MLERDEVSQGLRYRRLGRKRLENGKLPKPSTTTVLYTVSLSAANGGNTKPPEGK
jgi:hypothetical protein